MQKQVLVNDNEDQSQFQRATAVDRHVGSRLRDRRVMLGLSQQQLAGRVGITYQQAYKYEHGLNRVSAGRLFTIARALDVNPSWFFAGMQQEEAHEPAPHQRMLLELTRNFSLIKNELHQEALSQMARLLASEARFKADYHS